MNSNAWQANSIAPTAVAQTNERTQPNNSNDPNKRTEFNACDIACLANAPNDQPDVNACDIACMTNDSNERTQSHQLKSNASH